MDEEYGHDTAEGGEAENSDAPFEAPHEGARPLDADTILDSLLGGTIDWRNTVRRHPFGSVVCVGLVGYLVGRTKGATIMAGITAGLSTAMMRQLADVFDGDFSEF